MSVPRQNDPSTMILARPATAADDLGQHLHGAAAMVELTSAVIRHIDPLHPVVERDGRVLRGRNPLDDKRDLELVLDQFHGAPFQPLLEIAAGGADPTGPDVTLGDIALAPAVMRGIDSQTERRISARDRAPDTIFDEFIAAANIELKQTQGVGRCLRDALEAGLGYGAQHMGGSERTGGTGDSCSRAWIEYLKRTHRRQHDGQS